MKFMKLWIVQFCQIFPYISGRFLVFKNTFYEKNFKFE